MDILSSADLTACRDDMDGSDRSGRSDTALRSETIGPDFKRRWSARAADGEIELVEQSLVWQNRHVRVFNDLVRLPQRDRHGMHLERRHLRIAYGDSVKPGVVAVPLTAQDEIVLISQFRHAVRLWMLELPRGFGETAAVDRPDLTLGREVLEETGYTALQERYPLGRLVTDSGKLQDMLYLIAVRVQGPPVPRPEEGEVIRQVVTMPFSRLAQACSEGRIVDAFTLAAVARLFPHFEADRFRYGFAPGDDANRCLRHVGE